MIRTPCPGQDKMSCVSRENRNTGVFSATSCDGCPESPPTFRDPGYALRARGGCGPSRVRPASPSLVLGRRPAQWHFECFAAGPRGRSQGGASVPEHVRSHVPTRECSPATSTGSATPWPQAKSRSPAVIFSRRTSGYNIGSTAEYLQHVRGGGE